MKVSQFIQEVNDALRGVDDDAPTAGSEDYQYWLRTANRLMRNLYSDASKQWQSTYGIADLGAVTASTEPEFELEDDFLSPASDCYVIDAEGHRHPFQIIKAQDRDYRHQSVFVAGDPQKLFFTSEITAEEAFEGGTLYLPGYYMPKAFTQDKQTIPVDDPDWLVVATAAKIAFSDISYEDKFADLNSEANSLYKVMLNNNRRGTPGNPRRSRVDLVHKIRSPRSGR